MKNYFFTDNKSGKKTKEDWLKSNNRKLYDLIIQYTSHIENLSFRERIYLYINKLPNIPKCPNCNNNVNFQDSLKRGYNKYCSIKCLNQSTEHKEKCKKTFFKKYGVESHNQLEFIKNKKIKSYIKKYGVDNPMKLNIFKEKIKHTLLKNHGVDNPMKIEHVINNHKEKMKLSKEKNIKKLLNRILDDSIEFIEHIDSEFKFHCKKCSNDFIINRILLNGRLNLNIPICIFCNPLKSYSNLQKLISDEITNKIENDRKLLNGKEIDIYIPEINLGIEINGLYWHSEVFKDENYHLDKTKLANNKKIQLYHFFEDEILYKKDIVLSMINNKLHKNKIIHGRKCIIQNISSIKYSNFLENNHLQGNVNTKIKIGLYYDNELVSVIGFSKKRKVLGSKSIDGEYELVRFCNKLNINVVGGASKLLKYFIKNYNPNNIIFLADRRYSNGDLYEKLGFNLVSETKPNYFYFKMSKNKLHRYRRFKYRKDILVKQGYDPNKTEREIMLERKFLRIYDCGNLKYELKLN